MYGGVRFRQIIHDGLMAFKIFFQSSGLQTPPTRQTPPTSVAVGSFMHRLREVLMSRQSVVLVSAVLLQQYRVGLFPIGQ